MNHELAKLYRERECVVRPVLLPHLDRGVLAAGRQPLAGRVERNAPHGRAVRFERFEHLPLAVRQVLPVHADRVVVAGGREQILLRVPAHLLHVLRVPVQHRHTLVLVLLVRRVVDLPDPDRLVPAARGQQIARPGPGHALHLVVVPLQRRVALELACKSVC